MKNFLLITTLAMLTIAFNLMNSLAQSTQSAPPAQDTKPQEFLQTWHDACSKKDTESAEKCSQLSQVLIDKYPNVDKEYIDYAKKRIDKYESDRVIKAYKQFTGALESFYAVEPEPNKLEALFTAGNEYLALDKDPQSPAHLFVVAQQPLAGKRAVEAGVYQNLDVVKSYTETSLKAFETLDPPEKYKKEYIEYNLYNLRDEVMADSNQYLAYYLIQTKIDQPEAQDQALAYLDKSIQVKSNDSRQLFGWKDLNNYILRKYIYDKQYAELRRRYDALTAEQKTGDAGRELIEQINQLLDTKLIPELARVIATSINPALKDMINNAMGDFNNYWKFRVDDPAKATAYLKSFEADPTLEGPPVPAKAGDAAAKRRHAGIRNGR